MLRLILLASGLLAAPGAMAQVPAELLAGACQGCHGVNGQGSHGIPAIHQTRTRAEFVATLREFRDDQRQATVMGRIARGYADAEFAALAAHFAKPE